MLSWISHRPYRARAPITVTTPLRLYFRSPERMTAQGGLILAWLRSIVQPATTQYIDRDGAALAYQVVGDGTRDVVFMLTLNQHMDLAWTDPDLHYLYERAAFYSRTVYMQERGFGLSDRIGYTPTVDQHASDVLAVMDAIGMTRATLVGMAPTCAAASLVAAQHPERVEALILVNPISSLTASIDEQTDRELAHLVEMCREAFCERWGSGATMKTWDHVQDTAYNRRLMAMLERCSTTPAAAAAYLLWVLDLEYGDVLEAVQPPCRVLHIPTGAYPERAVRRTAELLPNATFHSLPEAPPGSSMDRR